MLVSRYPRVWTNTCRYTGTYPWHRAYERRACAAICAGGCAWEGLQADEVQWSGTWGKRVGRSRE
eukprot:664271-Pleurochrysis_carterae.AAC.2